MADLAAVEARVTQILTHTLHLDIPAADLDLFETGAIDSLAFVEFLLHLEREFGIKVALEDLELENFRTVRRIARFVVGRNGTRPQADADHAVPGRQP